MGVTSLTSFCACICILLYFCLTLDSVCFSSFHSTAPRHCPTPHEGSRGKPSGSFMNSMTCSSMHRGWGVEPPPLSMPSLCSLWPVVRLTSRVGLIRNAAVFLFTFALGYAGFHSFEWVTGQSDFTPVWVVILLNECCRGTALLYIPPGSCKILSKRCLEPK